MRVRNFAIAQKLSSLKVKCGRPMVSKLLLKYGTIIALLTLFTLSAIFVRGFATYSNIINILRQIALLFIISVGFTMSLIVDEFDLSFAGVASLSSIAVAQLIIVGKNYIVAIISALGIGVLVGLFNGLAVTVIGIPCIIVTLGTAIITGGLSYMFTKGVTVYGYMPQNFLILGRGNIGSIPVLVFIMFIVFAIFQFLVSKTKWGRHMRAVGGNKTAALLAGIKVNAYKVAGLLMSSTLAAFTGILLTARLGAATAEGASGFFKDGIAAALLGQTVINVGRPSPFGTFIGSLLIGILNNSLTLLGLPYYIHDIAKGIIVILSVLTTSIQTKRLEKA